MIGKPKYNINQEVTFNYNGQIKTGVICIIDSYGTFEQHEEVSYDILVKDENCLYKHVCEPLVQPFENNN